MGIVDIKTELEKNGSIICPSNGDGMMPLLRRGKDRMIISARNGEDLKTGDAVMFMRGTEYVVHRIVNLVSDGYLICGDNRKTAEHVKDSQIIGILTGVIRDGKEISAEDPKYKRYVKAVLEFRQPVQNMKALLGSVKRLAGKKTGRRP